MNNPTGPETVAAANALSGDKTFNQVQYAITGNSDADIISGILSVLAAHGTGHNQRQIQRIMEFLAARYKDSADVMERNYLLPNQEYMGQGIAGHAPPVAGLPYWTSTGVVDELAKQAITPQQQSEFLDRIRRWGQEAKRLPNALP